MVHHRKYPLFDLLPLPWGQGHTKCSQYLLLIMTYAPVKFKVAMSNCYGEEAFTKNTLYMTKVTPNVVQCPPNHMTFAPAKFEIATSNSLGEDAFTRKYII